jgi:hypothetical protein
MARRRPSGDGIGRTSNNIAKGNRPAAFAVPSLAQSRAGRVSVEREAAIKEGNREANNGYPWFEDMNRADVYRACMAQHGQAE